MKRGGGKAKGGSYERQFCKELSLWWTGTDDDAFWRTAGSGARATMRGKTNRATAGHCGDVGATDERGLPLMKVVSIELKRGRNKYTVADLLDKKKTAAIQEWEKWIIQARTSAYQAGAKYWMLIQRRDQRDEIAFFPSELWNDLNDNGVQLIRHLRMFTTIGGHYVNIVGTRWSHWKEKVSHKTIRAIAKKL